MTAIDACPCGDTTFTGAGTRTPTRVCVGCGRIADRCAHPCCDAHGDHQAGTEETEWCREHCPGAECVADRDETEVGM